VAEPNPSSTRLTRRRLLGGLGVGLASIPVLWWLDVPERLADAFQKEPTAPLTTGYVDRDGWMLAPEDVPAYEAQSATP
jgi:hypothetical protein